MPRTFSVLELNVKMMMMMMQHVVTTLQLAIRQSVVIVLWLQMQRRCHVLVPLAT
jgi:hypothetical protein